MKQEKPPVGTTKKRFPVPVNLGERARPNHASHVGVITTREQFYAAPYDENPATWERLIEIAHDARQDAPSKALEQDFVETQVNLELDALLSSRALIPGLLEIVRARNAETNAN